MNMGTILSEANEVNKQLQNEAKNSYVSPARGKISTDMPDFGHHFKELRKSDSDNEENIMEQTLGRTLTQQK